MRFTQRLPRVLIALGIGLLLTNSGAAQHDGEHRPSDNPAPGSKYYGLVDSIPGRLLGPASRSLVMERVTATPDIMDPAFDVYARPELIGMAYVPAPGHEAHAPKAFAAHSDLAVRSFASVPDALSALSPGGDVLIAGSLYLAGEVLRLNRELPD